MSNNLNNPNADQYSRLDEMELFRNKNDRNRFTFALRYPELDPERDFVWKQQANPFLGEGRFSLNDLSTETIAFLAFAFLLVVVQLISVLACPAKS